MRLQISSLDTISEVENLRSAQRIFDVAGFVIVPKEPTTEMNDAGAKVCSEHCHLGDQTPYIYRAMLAAAPKLV